MNELLQQHGCSNVFSVPEGLKELMSDISREVLRIQPKRLADFIAKYLSALLITREHGIMAVKILDDLCDCRPTVSEHLMQLGMDRPKAQIISSIIKEEIEGIAPISDGKENIREYLLVKKMLAKVPMDEETSAKVCEIARNAYRDYWYRKNLLKQNIKVHEEEPWEVAARNTLELYKKTKPSLSELHRATQKIQAAYRGYYIRRNVLRHLLPKKDKRKDRKVDLPGPPLDIGGSREIDLGPVVNIRTAVGVDNVNEMFDNEASANLGLQYDPTKMVTHIDDNAYLETHKKSASRRGVKLAEDDEHPSEKRHFADDTPIVQTALIREEDSGASYRVSPYARISFSEVPPEIIDLDYNDTHEEPGINHTGLAYDDQFGYETQKRRYHIGNMEIFQEIPEEPGADDQARIAGDDQEVPEDIVAEVVDAVMSCSDDLSGSLADMSDSGDEPIEEI